MLKPALLTDQALWDDVLQQSTDPHQFQLWWLGQSGFLLQWQGQRVLLDPYLSDSLTKKYAHTTKPHVRISERVIDPLLLRGIDVLSSSHNHTDHLDAETLQPILANNPRASFLIPEANRDFVVERVGCTRDFPIGLNDGQSVSIGLFTFYGVPAAHNELERDAQGNCRYMGYVVEFGPWKIYHSGDTLWYEGMVEVLRPFQVDIALLPINGHDPARGVAGNLNAQEAVDLGRAIGAKWVIPHHYDMFAFNTADPADFVAAAKKAAQNYCVLELGDKFVFSQNTLPARGGQA
ncbi:MBL fold metallo-hydrolase [Haliscomenobacter sp.]|uniref:MBL fold metallo-hydrolase n=1 Tax=Haliscomenobacter sp. TaxID=2717303 RepID=UPI0032E3A0F8